MHLTLHLTRACNMRCPYCYATPRADGGMSAELAQQVLEFAARLNPHNCGIVFFGGEPLLHEKLVRTMVADAHAMQREGRGRFHFKMTTNALLLSESFLDFAVENDVLIAMSFDGVREVHDRYRQLPDGSGTFELLLPKLHALLAARPYSSVLMTVNPDTASRLVDSVCFLLDEGCRYLIVSLNYAAEWTEADLAELERQYRRLGELYVEWTRAERKFYLSPFEVKLSSHIKGAEICKEYCELGIRQISVDPDGYLYPCVQFVTAGPQSRWCIGTVVEGIDEAARDRLRNESQQQREPCRQCALEDRCHNTCGCLNWQTTGNVAGISPVLCRHEQMLIPVADRVGEILFAERNPLFLHKHYNAAYPVLSFLEDSLTAGEAPRA